MGEIATFKKYMEDGIRDEIIDFTSEGKCSDCGNCCTNALPMSKKEVETVRKYIKEHHIEEFRHMTPLALAPIDMTCPFRNDKEKVCTIYGVRPKICRAFICNDSARSKKNREELANTRKIIGLRQEFFNNK